MTTRPAHRLLTLITFRSAGVVLLLVFKRSGAAAFRGLVLRMALVLVLFSAVNEADAANRIASVSGFWNNPATWGGAAVPTINDSITINAGITVTLNVHGYCSRIKLMLNGSMIDGTGGTDTLTINTVGILAVTGTATISCNLVMPAASTITIAAVASSLTISGQISGAGTMIIKAGAGELIMSNLNTYAGQTIINAGTLSANTLANAGTNSSLGTGVTTPTISISGAGTLKYTGSGHSTSRVITLTGSGATINASGSGTMTLSGGVTGNTFNLVLSGTGAGIQSGLIGTTSGTVTKSGTGTWTLSGASTYTGTTTISAGTLIAGAAVPNLTNSPFGRSSLPIYLGDAATTANNSSPSLLTGGAFTIGRSVTVANQVTSGIYSIGGNTANTSVFSGAVTISQPLSITQVGSGTIQLSGNLTANSNKVTKIGAGTFQRTSAILMLSGQFEVTAGIYDAFGQQTRVTDLTTVSGGEYQAKTAAQTFNGGLIISGGTFTGANGNVTTTNLTLSNGVLTAPSGILSVKGNWVYNGGTFSPGTNTVTFNGTASQTIGGTASTTFYNFILINAAGAVLGNSETVVGTLTLTNGWLVLGSYNLTLGPSSPPVAGSPSATNMIVAEGTGELRKNYTANGSYLFPVGDATGLAEYSPITLNFTSGSYSSAYAGVRVINAKHPNNASAINYLTRYWAVTSSGITSFSCNVTGTYVAADIAGTENLQVAGRYTGSLPWIKYSTLGSYTLIANGVTLLGGIFGDFTGISAAAPTVTISANPSLTVCPYTFLTLTANPVGDPTFTYSWNTTPVQTTQSINPPTAIPESTVYTVTVTDGNGFTATSSVTVTVVNDTQNPTITCPGNQTATTGPLICVANVSIPAPVYSDNCSVSKLTWTMTGATVASSPLIGINIIPSPYVFNGGVTTVTYRAEDLSGNFATCTFTVTVVDNQAPLFVNCPNNIIVDAPADQCSKIVTFFTPIAIDNCTGDTVIQTAGPPSGSSFPIGTTTIVFTAVDGFGNTATCTFQVIVKDATPPVITFCPRDTMIVINNNCSVTIPYGTLGLPVASELCSPPVVMTNNYPAGGIFVVGVTYVTYTATDAAGNSSSCIQTVIITRGVVIVDYNYKRYLPPWPINVIDTLLPDNTAPGVNSFQSFSANAIGRTQIVNDGVAPGPAAFFQHGNIKPCLFTDAQQGNDMYYQFDMYNMGTSYISYYLYFQFKKHNNSNPRLIKVEWSIDGINYIESLSIDVFTGYQPNQFWEIYQSLVEITELNNSPFVSFRLHFGGGGNPKVFFDNFQYVALNEEIQVAEAIATNVECPHDTDGSIEIFNTSSGSWEYTINGGVTWQEDPFFPNLGVGTYDVRMRMYQMLQCDVVINVAFPITDNDSIPPLITYCTPDTVAAANTPANDAAILTLDHPAYSDNCSTADSINITWVLTGATNGSGTGMIPDNYTFLLGLTYVTYTFTDESGNTSECSFTVLVLAIPEITCPLDLTANIWPGVCWAELYPGYPTVNSSSGIDTITWIMTGATTGSGAGPIGAHIFNAGITYIEWTATNSVGSDSCVQVITIVDNLAPVFTECPQSIDTIADLDQLYATLSLDPPVYSDNCTAVDNIIISWVMTGATVTSGTGFIPVPFLFYVDTTFVTYTATDVFGNAGTCSFIVIVAPNDPPEMTCPADITVNTDMSFCTATLDPGSPTLVSGSEPITWTWTMSGATVDTGTGNPIAPTPYPFNEGITYITWIATNISGADSCQQLINVIDTMPPTFDTAGPLEFCVYEIDSATYDGQPEPLADIVPDRPDWYIIDGTTELDISNIYDNCCVADSLIHWIINFTGIPAHLPLIGTGQPSDYGPITLWGTNDYTVVVNTITYVVEDCNGNLSNPVTVNITMNPRPNVIKQ